MSRVVTNRNNIQTPCTTAGAAIRLLRLMGGVDSAFKVVLAALTVVVVTVTVIRLTRQGTITTDMTITTVSTQNTATATTTAPFTLLVQLTFTELQYQKQFVTAITPLCQYIQEFESNTTLSYEVLYSDQNPLQVLVLERYSNRDPAYVQIHKSSLPFVQFRTQLQVLKGQQHVTIQGSSYYDSGIGYVKS
jgi:quinol monooxygenase YgiN